MFSIPSDHKQMQLSKGKQYSPAEGAQLQTQIIDLKAEKAVVALQVNNFHNSDV